MLIALPDLSMNILIIINCRYNSKLECLEYWGCYSVWRNWRKPVLYFELWKFGHKSKKQQITNQAALSLATDLAMALSQQQVTASNSLVCCWTVIACCCVALIKLLPLSCCASFSLPYSDPWEPLQSKQKSHEQCSFLSFSCPGKEFAEHHLCHVLHSQSQKHSRLTAYRLVLTCFS